jgi:maleate isomerase
LPDVNGYRAKWGVITPSPNTVVEHDLNVLRPPGMTFHVGRMYIEHPEMDSDSSFERLLTQISESSQIALRDVLTCEPDYIILGVSAEAFNGGVEGNEDLTKRLETSSGLQVTTPPTACLQALRKLNARRISILSPYQPFGDKQVQRFFTEAGFDIVNYRGLKCPSAVAIGNVSRRELAQIALDLDADNVDAILQVGANLPMLRVAPLVEVLLGKPVLSINSVALWYALRRNGFQDQLEGFGRLFSDF